MDSISYEIAERMTTPQLLRERERISTIMEQGADDPRPLSQRIQTLSSMAVVCDTLVDRLTNLDERGVGNGN